MFQYNPRYFSLERTLLLRQVEDWTAFWERAHLAEGQLVYIFRSGKHAGIAAVGHLATPLYERLSKDRFGRYWVDIAFDALVDPLLTRATDIAGDPLLREYKPYAEGVFRSNVLLPVEVAARTWSLVRSRLRPIRAYSGPEHDLATLVEQEQQESEDAGEFDPTGILDMRRRAVAAIVRRQGQPAFRAALLEAYGKQCAITGCDVVEVLEAAHIMPYLGAQTNHPANGLLLRADLHTLFDWGLIAVDTSSMTVLVSPRLASSAYANLAGVPIRMPERQGARPSAAALSQHREWSDC